MQAREFVANIGEHGYVLITRYTNHHRLIPNGGWAVCGWREHYLSEEKGWAYKYGTAYSSAEEALQAAQNHSEELDQIMRDFRDAGIMKFGRY